MTLVGGGPGDPDLLTLAGAAALQEADVVLYDRLGPRDRLPSLAPAALLIDVGKTPGHHAVPQDRINDMLVHHAREGRRVVRLKGGDAFVFGRGGEEAAACHEAGIEVRVVPGVSSAIAVPAAAGIPVTHREVSRSFTVISGHVPLEEAQLSALVALGGTIVVLMGVNGLHGLVTGLRRHGMDDAMPLAVVERGFSPQQRTLVTTVGSASLDLARERPQSPAVIVIGEVVRVAPAAAVLEAAREAGGR
ncbi:uroporphyrinogen-III C-methyltransferase [Microbacterium sp. SORGH_AS_0888]|uniref:uroporphyrinogen-III C-methyltransferase n=1 Tax=Microbacterium sp. SORGH_AS_0888 TaxID=3041791 RepID=UPI0027D8A3F9|nr:uroporphyrinogen-III C-methyltransferase [Microbacterium sp. SORGH_AS_0888]